MDMEKLSSVVSISFEDVLFAYIIKLIVEEKRRRTIQSVVVVVHQGLAIYFPEGRPLVS